MKVRIVKSFEACITYSVIGFTTITAHAHDLISPTYMAGEKALADLQAARDRVLTEPQASPNTKQAAEAFVATAFVWSRPNLTVCFWQTSQPELLRAIADYANLWSVGTRITFDYGGNTFRQCVSAQTADIRVTTQAMPDAYYSAVDRPLIAWDWSDYGNLPSKTLSYVSMSLVHAPENFAFNLTPQLSFLVAHEFGHALGLIHEHQRIDCTQYLAKKDIVKQAFRWTNDSDYNTFVVNLAQIPSSDPALRPLGLWSFDSRSVMMYNFPQQIWATEVNNPCARPQDVQSPDANDIAAVNYFYGSPTLGPVAAASPPPSAIIAPTASLNGTSNPAVPFPPSVQTPNPLPAISRETAKQALESAAIRHSDLASGANVLARGGRSIQRAHARAAESIQNLLSTMARIDAGVNR